MRSCLKPPFRPPASPACAVRGEGFAQKPRTLGQLVSVCGLEVQGLGFSVELHITSATVLRARRNAACLRVWGGLKALQESGIAGRGLEVLGCDG